MAKLCGQVMLVCPDTRAYFAHVEAAIFGIEQVIEQMRREGDVVGFEHLVSRLNDIIGWSDE